MTPHMRVPSFFRNNPFLYAAPIPAAFYIASRSSPTSVNSNSQMSTSAGSPGEQSPAISFPTRSYTSSHRNFPYTVVDFTRADESEDEDFYSSPRFVTHIDDHAIGVLKKYYAAELPQKGRILDLCSSWISHFPKELEEKANAGKDAKEDKIEVIGLGMNKKELDANPILCQRMLQNLNTKPQIPAELAPLDVTVCVVSIDYLTSPLEVLTSVHRATKLGGKVHLVISNRCFPTKAVGRWLRVGEQERLNMVGEYLWWSGWRAVEIIELCDGTVPEGEVYEADGLKGGVAELMRRIGLGGGSVDPLWVVRGLKMEDGEASKV